MEELPKRKPLRLTNFDYSSTGAYFITICTENRKNLLSTVVGEGLAPPAVQLKLCGKVAQKQLLLLEQRYPNVKIDKYVIMPNHIHLIIILRKGAGGASPSPTVSDVICTFKSLTSRICKKEFGIEKIFQRSYMDHIIRDRDDYETRVRYIYGNPMRWYYDELYLEE